MKRIGEHLTEKGLVTSEAVERALKIQTKTGSKLGNIMQAEGIISSYKFYQELADFQNREFINLEEYEVDRTAMMAEERTEYLEMQYLPFDIKEGMHFIATANPTEELENYLIRKYTNIKVFITSPYDILWTLQRCFDKDYIYRAAEELFENSPISSSKFIFTRNISKIACVLGLLAFAYSLKNREFLIDFLIVMNFFFMFSILSKLLFFTVGLFTRHKDAEILNVEDRDLPTYSILVPLLNEKKKTISSLIDSIGNLDYPKEKLDIKLIVEISDYRTAEFIKTLKPNYNFQIIRVPENYPKTKPKACNYALHFCKGEYITIYDAEDAPETQQLKKALAKFYNDEKVMCVQARLNYYNREENVLTKLFAIEYASWFDYMLYGLQKLKLPIPLGGTSNHFRINVLRSLYAWDPYNVTEDADLGVRMALAGMKTEVMDSLTLEEAPIKFNPWLKQRIRWIKGYLQTYIVHMRSPVKLMRKLGPLKFLGFFFFIGAPGIIYFTVPIVTALTLFCILNGSIMPAMLTEFSYANLAATVLINLFISIYVANKKGWKSNMSIGVALFPFYWLLHCIASFFAIYELIKMPHHWNKTEHGLSKFER